MTKGQKIDRLFFKLQGALMAQGHFGLSVQGDPYPIPFSGIYIDPEMPFVFFVVDIDNLPPGINLKKLSSHTTEDRITATIGYPVRGVINGTGLIFCIKM